MGEPAPTVFITNFLGMWAPADPGRRCGQRPVMRRRRPHHRRRDISAVAAKHCSPMSSWGAKIPLTGTQAFTNTELVRGHRHGSCSPVALSEVPAELVAPALPRLGFSPEFADAYIRVSGGNGFQTGTCTARGGEDSRQARRDVRRRRCGPSAHCSPISKGDKSCRNSSTAVPQADEQGHDGGPEARHPDRPGRCPACRQKTGKPRSTPMTPFRARRRASTSWPAIQAPTGRRTRVQPVRHTFARTQIAAREKRSSN